MPSLEVAVEWYSQGLHEQASVPVGFSSGLDIDSTTGDHLEAHTRTVSTSRCTKYLPNVCDPGPSPQGKLTLVG